MVAPALQGRPAGLCCLSNLEAGDGSRMGELDQLQGQPLLGGAEIGIAEPVVPGAVEPQIPAVLRGLQLCLAAAWLSAIGQPLPGLIEQCPGPRQKLRRQRERSVVRKQKIW